MDIHLKDQVTELVPVRSDRILKSLGQSGAQPRELGSDPHIEHRSASTRKLMRPSEKRDVPYIFGLACLAAALMIALAAFWR